MKNNLGTNRLPMFKTNIRLIFRINAIVWTVCVVLVLLLALMFNGFEKQQLQTRIDQSKVLLEALFQQKRELLANEIFANHREALLRTLAELKNVKDIDAIHLYDIDGRLSE